MKPIAQTLVERDGITFEEARELVADARRRVQLEGEDPEEILYDEFGLEPDYVMELL